MKRKIKKYLAWFDIVAGFLLCVFDYPAEVFREGLDLLFLAVSVQQRQRIAQEVGVEGYKAGLLTREQALEELKSRGEELGVYSKVEADNRKPARSEGSGSPVDEPLTTASGRSLVSGEIIRKEAISPVGSCDH